MSPAEYDATIQHSLPLFVLVPPPEELTFIPGDTAVGREDTKLLYNKIVYLAKNLLLQSENEYQQHNQWLL